MTPARPELVTMKVPRGLSASGCVLMKYYSLGTYQSLEYFRDCSKQHIESIWKNGPWKCSLHISRQKEKSTYVRGRVDSFQVDTL